jgi:hypothetical protein
LFDEGTGVKTNARNRRQTLAFFALSALGVAGCSGVAGPATRSTTRNYSDALRGALEPYTDRLPGYHYRSTPLGNFGVGSIYLSEVRSADLSHAEGGWYLGDPQTWLAVGLSPEKRREWRDRLISEGSFGAFQIDANQRRAIEANLGIAVFVALGVDASLNFEQGASVSFRASEVRNRRLNWAEFSKALAAGLVEPEVAKVVRTGAFVIAASDVVLLDYRAEVTVDESINPSLAASLRAKSLQSLAKGGTAVGASLTVRESMRGQFVATSTLPVIAAVLFKQPPPLAKGGLPPSTNLDAWPVVDVLKSSLDAVEARVLQSAR